MRIGEQYGQMKVISEAYTRPPRRNKVWDVVCVKCGRETTKNKEQLEKHSGCRSCSTAERNRRVCYKGTKNITGKRVARVRTNALKRGYEFELTAHDFQDIWDAQGGRCAYTGLELTEENWSPDRFDNDRGYEKDNVRIVVRDVNYAKQSLAYEEFVNLCKLVVENAD